MTAAIILFHLTFVTSALGWGGPHATITKAACKVLPQWQQEMWGDELQALGNTYCMIPDRVYEGKEIARYAMMDSKPGVLYLVGLHLPPQPTEAYEMLRYFLDKAVTAIKDNRIGDAARYTGTVSHMLEDWGCPAHAVPNDNMFTLFKQFLPPPDKMKYTLLHSPLENGHFAVDLKDYKPRLLGTSVAEAAFNLLHESHKTTVYARGQVIPIMQGLYNDNQDLVNSAQQKSAFIDAKLVADACYTIVCIAKQKFRPEALPALKQIDMAEFFPLEAPKLYMPQSNFFGKPYWGFARANTVLKDGKEAVPLKLKNKTITSCIGTGTHSTLTYLLPANIYKSFKVTVGLHPDLGKTGSVIFEIKGNGKTLKKTDPISGADTAQLIDVPLTDITELQLTAKAATKDAGGNYAIWGEPTLVK